MDVVRVESIEGCYDSWLIAGVQPFGAECQLAFGPCRTEGAHGRGVGTLLG